MPKVTIDPIAYPKTWQRELARVIFEAYKEIFRPLLEAIQNEESKKLNARESSEIEKALARGDLVYRNGWFVGKSSAKLSKEFKSLGATFKDRRWFLPSSSQTSSLQKLIKSQKSSIDRLSKEFDSAFSKMSKTVKNTIDVMPVLEFGKKVADKTSKEFISKVNEAISVQPKIRKEGLKEIIQDYTETRKLPISMDEEVLDSRVKKYSEKFAFEEIVDLRKTIEQMKLEGTNVADIKDFVMSRLKVSKERANFIGQQETQLFMSNIHKQQSKQAGANEYMWITQGDGLVRESHRHLHGKTFSWDNPPIVDEKTGRTGHPRQDFRCRCIARSIIKW